MFGRRSAAVLLSSGLVVASAAAIATGTTAAPAAAASTDGALTVQVIRDMGANGVYDSLIDLPLSGVSVKVTDQAGGSITLTTDASGVATIPAGDTRLTGGHYRVDVDNPDASYYQPAFASSADPSATPSAVDLSSNQEFVDVSGGQNVTMTTGFWHTHDYCQSNPMVANACQPGIFSHAQDAPETSARTTVFVTPYQGQGDDPAGFTAESDSLQTGAVYGIGYNRKTQVIFAGAYAKRNAAFGPAGPGGIYRIDRATGTTSVFTTVPNAGTVDHDLTPVSAGGDEDMAFTAQVGKESLGGIAISDDYSKLYVVNEFDKLVYVYDATQATAAAPLDTIDVSANPCGAGTTDNDWRPMGLGVNDGILYVGGVCTGEDEATVALKNPATMKAIVQTYDQTSLASLGTVVDQPLNFNKGDTASQSECAPSGAGAGVGGWLAWDKGFAWCAGTRGMAQPMLGKILVEANGNLDLGFRDRFGDQVGMNLAIPVDPANGGGTYRFGDPTASGDTNLACPDGSGMYVMDVNGGCGIASVAAGQPVNRYYAVQGLSPHVVSTFAGMTMSRAEIGLITDHMDSTGVVESQGLSVLSRDGAAGGMPYNQRIVEASGTGGAPTVAFGKGQGLADMDVLCDLAPIQIGNRVWYNAQGDGKQNAGEAPVVGATVNLYDKNGNLVATTTTNDKGEYYFDSLTTPGLTTNTDYVVKMDNPADYAAGGPLEGWKLAKTTTGPDGNPASTGSDGYPAISLTTGDHGEDNHSYDFGFKQTPKIHVVKYDGRLAGPTNVNGSLGHDDNAKHPTVYQAGKNGRTGKQPVRMIVTNTGTAPLGSVKISDKTITAPKMTGLTCNFSALGGPSKGTTWSGPFQPGDSFPCTGKVDLIAGQKHADQISVSGVQLNPLTGKPVDNAPTVRDADSYYAKTGYQAKIDITKRDWKTGYEADTPGKAMLFHRGETRLIAMPATNVGTAPVHNVVISDQTLRGAKITNLRCTFPGGKVVRADGAGRVRWAASFGKNPRLWMPGVTIHCYGSLKMKAGAKLHGDRIKVQGAAPNGKRLHDSNPFYAKVPLLLPGVPDTGARLQS